MSLMVSHDGGREGQLNQMVADLASGVAQLAPKFESHE
jgi:hypothetical protein